MKEKNDRNSIINTNQHHPVISVQNNHKSKSEIDIPCQTEAVMKIKREAFDKIFFSICSRPAESGGILIGPIGTDDITDFYFDAGGTCTNASYSPDYITVNKMLKELWIPNGLDYKGIGHSHPGNLDWPTPADLAYIRRLLTINEDMEMFFAPIIIPPEFRMRPTVVFKNNPGTIVEARIDFF